MKYRGNVFYYLFHNVVVPNLDTYFVNIFSSVSSYHLYLLSPVLILYSLSQKVTRPIDCWCRRLNLLLRNLQRKKEKASE